VPVSVENNYCGIVAQVKFEPQVILFAFWFQLLSQMTNGQQQEETYVI